ncbi:MAG: 1,4-dihydroxy-2-naphthoate polyprenyltransferase [Bacteroidales bacterium]|nr:1,4-dihydroxy-2-naphthoate polyprenyltransferase [Bacteroidales bacterium]
MNFGVWIKAYRIRTLPLALSSTIMGSFLAYAHGKFLWAVFILTASTTLFLQVLSNLANDYGDSVHGVDNKNRVGPGRVVQSGLVTRRQMLLMITVFILLALISGTWLILISLDKTSVILVFFMLGFAAIIAAIKYTVGKRPYGYVGLGDIFVFLFFGIVGVAGTYYLHTHSFDPWVLLPASTIGLLSSGVLNLNNMRDIVNDTAEGKRTLVVRIGTKNAKTYHVTLISLSIILSIIYTLRYFHSVYQLIYIFTFPLFILNLRVVLQSTEPIELNVELKKLALSTFAFSITFGLGLVL